MKKRTKINVKIKLVPFMAWYDCCLDDYRILRAICKIYEEKNSLHMGLGGRKPVFGGLRTTKAQTSLPIHAV